MKIKLYPKDLLEAAWRKDKKCMRMEMRWFHPTAFGAALP